jgi:hypothetical protein
VERSSYRYEPRPDRNIELREELVKLARQKPRYGYRRLHALLERRGHEVNVKRDHQGLFHGILPSSERIDVNIRLRLDEGKRDSLSCSKIIIPSLASQRAITATPPKSQSILLIGFSEVII